ncbi:MAG: restriction endonuclease [Verrucomicrobiae bacterium]|nr:restriction endonuclease [Verrucomicrobiae bacterium]NNJ43115.1 restriction endonuclease [Akkermansiaceae bacterium]
MPKKNSFVNDLILAPWWVSLILAGVTYFIGGILPGITSSDMAITMIVNIARSSAPIFSIALIFVSLLSFIRSVKTRSQLKRQKSVDTLNELSWKSFEDVIGELFRQRGYRVEEMLGGGADGGVDLRLRKDGQFTLVQCKRWKKQKVGLPVMRELLGANELNLRQCTETTINYRKA